MAIDKPLKPGSILGIASFSPKLMFGQYDMTDEVPAVLEGVLEAWINRECVTINKSRSFGYVLGNWRLSEQELIRQWDNPYKFTGYVMSVGKEGPRYVYNAIRKLRPTIRTGVDTLRLRTTPGAGAFINKVKSADEDGASRWGDYPWGGAVWTSFAGTKLVSAVSGFEEDEDDAIARVATAFLQKRMLRATMPELFVYD